MMKHKRLNIDALEASGTREILQWDNKYTIGGYVYLLNRYCDGDGDEGYIGQCRVKRGERIVDTYKAFAGIEEQKKAEKDLLSNLDNQEPSTVYDHSTESAVLVLNQTEESHYQGRILARFNMPTTAYFHIISKLPVYKELEETLDVYAINWGSVREFFESQVSDECIRDSRIFPYHSRYPALRKFILKAKLQDLLSKVKTFDEECSTNEYTDTEHAWWLFNDIERELTLLSTIV